MGINVNITKHIKRTIGIEGQEVYPAGHPYQGMARPASEIQRDPSLPPKSEAEERMDIINSIDDESRAAIELLRNKGLIN